MFNLFDTFATFFDSVKMMHEKFGISYNDNKFYTKEESEFRKCALYEELDEYKNAKTDLGQLDALVDLTVFLFTILERKNQMASFYNEFESESCFLFLPNVAYYKKHFCIAMKKYIEKEDLARLMKTIVLAINLHGYELIFKEAFHRVMLANMRKRLGPLKKRNNYELNLLKPKDWEPANLDDLIKRISNFRRKEMNQTHQKI